MSKRDYYEILGVSKTASDTELKSSFRKLAMGCHPDRHPGDTAAEAKFKELNEAYQVLSDGQKRAAYDRHGHAAFEHGGGQQGPEFSDFMSDIFDSFFGERGGRGGPRR
ncbi:DnaJ domain-containing protein, partial [Bosea sp. (in: a-proteobacteria)]|uniref:DnaJ domain-containing protein n=1 Tax=Bosea sp. (in: a-proteobacteria) TaxID=1871050 RepID=UPI003569115C